MRVFLLVLRLRASVAAEVAVDKPLIAVSFFEGRPRFFGVVVTGGEDSSAFGACSIILASSSLNCTCFS